MNGDKESIESMLSAYDEEDRGCLQKKLFRKFILKTISENDSVEKLNLLLQITEDWLLKIRHSINAFSSSPAFVKIKQIKTFAFILMSYTVSGV